MRRVVSPLIVLCLGFAPAPVYRETPSTSVAADLKAMQGKWRRLTVESGGPKPVFSKVDDVVSIDGNQITYGFGKPGSTTWTLTLGEAKPIRSFDIESKRGYGTQLGCYRLTGNTLRICTSTSGARPAGLRPGRSQEALDTLVRAEP